MYVWGGWGRGMLMAIPVYLLIYFIHILLPAVVTHQLSHPPM